MSTTQQKIAVMAAAESGQQIEHRRRGSSDSWKPAPRPVWNWYQKEYRVAPTPREIWVNANLNGSLHLFKRAEDAFLHRDSAQFNEVIHFREVLKSEENSPSDD